MMGHELIFMLQGGNMRGTFSVWSLEKNGPNFKVAPSLG
jgi:hypothetical protein